VDKLDDKIKELIAEYLNSEISEENLEKLEQLADKEDLPLADFVQTFQQLDEIEAGEPGGQMDENFYSMLEAQKEKIAEKENRWGRLSEQLIRILSVPQVPRLAYGVILLLIGIVVGNMLMPNRGYEQQISSMSAEMGQMRELMVLSMIKGDQATERIKAVNYVDKMESVDNKIIDALFKTLNNDKNTNVRLVSLEALAKFVELPKVREGLIKSINQQDSPIVLMTLADILVKLNDKRFIEELKNLLKKEDLDPTLRSILESEIPTSI
jgi:hypothetical protein